MLQNLIALPYEVARGPLAIVDRNLTSRLSETSPPRVLVDRALGSADRVAGAVLRNREISRRGRERLERSSTLVAAARLEAQAETRRAQAREVVESARSEAEQNREAARDRVTSGLKEADEVEKQGTRQARARAAKAATARKSSADQVAAARVKSAEQRTSRASAAATSKETAAARRTRSELKAADKDRQSATQARLDAERLDDLVDAKKDERKQD